MSSSSSDIHRNVLISIRKPTQKPGSGPSSDRVIDTHEASRSYTLKTSFNGSQIETILGFKYKKYAIR